jgi:hypothetical protein
VLRGTARGANDVFGHLTSLVVDVIRRSTLGTLVVVDGHGESLDKSELVLSNADC